MAKPRRIYLLKTEHFDFLFSEPSAGTAKLLADNGDRLYELARRSVSGHGGSFGGGGDVCDNGGDDYNDVANYRTDVADDVAASETNVADVNGGNDGNDVNGGNDVNEAVVHDLRIPVVISPDSDRLSVNYTCSPYNRIVIFEGVPEPGDNDFQNTLLGLFFHEVYLALSQSVRDPINQFIYETVGGDGYQPISLVYLPFSFVEGRAFLEEGQNLEDGQNLEEGRELEEEQNLEEGRELENFAFENSELENPNLENSELENLNFNKSDISPNYNESEGYGYGRFCDGEFLEFLSIAKYENKFPSWIQAGSARDIYPGRLLNEAAGSAFSAYLMHTYGIEKYVEFWNECGKINFNLTSGMFKKVYGSFLSDLWADFEESVPLPDNLEKIKELEKETKSIFKGDTEGLITNLIISDYGLVWYDDIRHEVDILDLNSTFLMRQLLFLASDVKKLSLSNDGRYLVVSFYGIKTRPEFRNDKVWIYDLQKREFTDHDFRLRDGVIVETSSNGYAANSCTYEDVASLGTASDADNVYADNIGSDNKISSDCLAGIYVKDKLSSIYIYSLDYNEKKEDLLYKKTFPSNEYPCNLTYAGPGKVSYIVSKNNKESFRQYDFENNIERNWNIIYKGNPIKIKNLRLLQAEKTELKVFGNKKLYTFEYLLPDQPSFTRMGVIVLDEDFQPQEVYFQDCDVAGGVKSPSLLNNHILFCSNKFTHNEINYIPKNILPFIKGSIEENTKQNNIEDNTNFKNTVFAEEKLSIDNKKIGNYNLDVYNPLKYMSHISFVPFMALKDLATEKEQKLWPSLGGTFITQYDPFMNSRIMLSGSAGYAKLDFTTIVNPTIDDVNEKKEKDVDDNKNISFGISIENTSTPVDIRAGCIFKFNTEGEYNFGVNANTFFQVPVGMAFSKFNFSIHGNYTASTDYYDRNIADHFPSLSNWPSFQDAYETGKLTFSAEYTNIHQYGISKYEKRGFSLGIKLDSFWDITEIKFLNEKIDKLEEELEKGDKTSLTQAQINILRRQEMLQISQLILGGYVEVKIPRITPFNMIEGLIFSMPSTIKAELFNEPGTAVKATAEILLLGYECQNGLPFLYLYFSRLGLKFGYDINLNYDTLKIPLPDIRVKDNLWDIFSNTYVRDSIYFIYNMDFCAAIGRLSEYHLNLSMKTEYFIRSEGFAFSLNFLVSF